MIYLSNFFARRIEAVSKQIEDARQSKNDPIITCCYFLGQKPLRFSDLKDNIWIFPQKIYPFIASLVMLFSKSDIHYFEDEPSKWRLFFMNLRKRNIYISLFKDVNQELVEYLNKIKGLRAIVVEDEQSGKIVRKYLRNRVSKIFLQYPSPIWKPELKKLSGKNHLLFASWNGGDKNTLDQRGVLDLLHLVRRTNVTCTIILRDAETKYIEFQIKNNNVSNLVSLVKPSNFDELKKEFEKSSYTVLIPRKAVMKYVPNSIIDGLSMGKPCLISKNLRLHTLIEKKRLGVVLDNENMSSFNFPNLREYQELSNRCYKWAVKNLDYPYSKVISKIYK